MFLCFLYVNLYYNIRLRGLQLIIYKLTFAAVFKPRLRDDSFYNMKISLYNTFSLRYRNKLHKFHSWGVAATH